MDAIIDSETQPLLAALTNTSRHTTSSDGCIDFDAKGDPENPLEWPKAYKNGVVWLLALMAFTVTFTCIGLVPVADRIIFDLEGKDDKTSSILLVTVWELGEACGPLLIAPLSEIYGRKPVFNIANIIFILAIVLAALSQTVGLLIFARFLTGVAVAGNVLNPVIVGDIFTPETRGSGMSLVMLAPLLGGAIGPAISGLIAETLGWRSVLWMAAALAVLCEVVLFLLLRETYKVTILQKRAARLRKELNDETIRCVYDTNEDDKNFWSELRIGVSRPMHMMADSSVLQILSLYGVLEFTFYYIMATTLPAFLREIYGLSPAVIGYCFMGFTAGASIGVLFSNVYLDRIYIALAARRKDAGRPEDRLPFMIVGGALFPGVVALYGWAPYAEWPLWLLLLSLFMLGFLLCGVSISLSSYVIDAFGLYSASAMTSVLITRCLGGTFLPMAIPPLTDALGVGYGFLVLAAICLASLPMPCLVMRYGSAWRQRSKYTRAA